MQYLALPGVPDDAPKFSSGRIIHFQRPDEPDGPVTCGTAVLDSGPFAGQRVEFDAQECFAFGYPLAKADLSQIFKYGTDI